MSSTLEIKDLHVSIEDKEILKGVNLTINTGEIHAIMGPNGTGKSTLSSAIMGHPSYEVTQGEVLLDGVNILELEVDERAKVSVLSNAISIRNYWCDKCRLHAFILTRNVKKDKKST